MKLHTYLNFGGNCRQAFTFYERHLGGKVSAMMTRAEQPGRSRESAQPGWEDSILYARMSLGGTEIQGSDVPPERFRPMRSVYLSLTLDTTDEAERLYALLSEGGQIFMPMEETFFAFRFGMLRDRFGTSWMILCQKPQNG